MSQPPVQVRVNLLSMLVAIVGFALAVIYGTIAFSAQDPIWFVQGFDEQPTRMIVYHAGQRTEYQAGQAGFDELAQAVQASLSRGVARPSGIGLSDESLADAYRQYVTLEVFFDRPVKLHAWFNTGQPTQMLFLITGRHSEMSVVFLGVNGKYMSSAPVLNTTAPILEALKSLGFGQGAGATHET
jgi:hypothetical protein